MIVLIQPRTSLGYLDRDNNGSVNPLLSTLCALLIFLTSGFAQSPQASAGVVSKDKLVDNILRIEGANDQEGETNITYTTPEALKQEDRERGRKLQWSEEKIKAEENNVDRFSPGGLVQLYLTRTSVAAANTGNFTIILKNTAGKVLVKKTLYKEPPMGKKGNYYYAIAVTTIHHKVEGTFFVDVIDGFSGKTFKFQVNQ